MSGRAGFSGLRFGIVCPMANEAQSAVRFADAVLDETDRYDFDAVTLFVVLDKVSRDDAHPLDAHRETPAATLRRVGARG